MKKASDFKWFVAINLQDQISLVAFCPECGFSMSFMDGAQPTYTIQSHQCNQKIVSEPKGK